MIPGFARGPSGSLLLTGIVVATLVAVVWRFVHPAPPGTIVLGTGVPGGAYAMYGKQYAEILARDGINVVLRESAGAIENLDRLSQAGGDVDVAFVQSGVARAEQRKGLVSLGSLYYEPFWAVYRGDFPLERLTQLAGKRLGVGAAGSGSHALALKLLDLNGIGPAQATLVEQDAKSMVDALAKGGLDAAFFVVAPGTPLWDVVLHTPELHVMNMVRALSYQRRFPELTRITLPAGVLDLERNLPSQEIQTVAATAMLVARKELHPAIAYLLVRASMQLHSGPDLLSDAHTFPTIAGHQEFDVPEDVQRLYKEGPPLLYRHLPFWLANLIYRMWLVGFAGLAIVFSITDWIPKVFRHLVDFKVGRNYLAARKLEDEIRAAGPAADFDEYRRRLEALRKHTDAIRLPLLLSLTKSDLHRRLDEVNETLAARIGPGDQDSVKSSASPR
jgi:TRAP transporter TAXI family solute receptor